jgi:hypothetical protein
MNKVRYFLLVSVLGILSVSVCIAATNSPGAKKVLRRFSESRNNMNSFLIEGQIDIKYNDGYNDGVRHIKFNDKYDGDRSKTEAFTWGHLGNLFPDVKENNAHYTSQLWDGDSYYTYSRGSRGKNPSDLGMVIISRKNDSEGFQKGFTNIVKNGFSGQIMGYNRYDNGERIDKMFDRAEHLKLREERENLRDVDCYVIDAVVKGKGEYTVWIDPIHDFHIAKIQVHRKENDYIIQNRLKKGDYSNEVFEILCFERVGDSWFPKECKWKNRAFQYGKTQRSEYDIKFTKVVFNPDHEAMKSFLPTDIPNGTEVKLRAFPPSRKFIWQDGEVVSSIDQKARN